MTARVPVQPTTAGPGPTSLSARAAAELTLRVGDLVREGDLPAGAAYVVTEELPQRWGLRRWRCSDQRGGPAAEAWGPGERLLPEALGALRGVSSPNLQQVLGRARGGPRRHEVMLLALPGGPGETLAASAAVSPQVALEILGAVGRGLDALHQAGLCHLDVRPEHVVRTGDERIAVLVGLGQVRREGLLGLATSDPPGPPSQRTGEHGPDDIPEGMLPDDPFTAPELLAHGLLDRRADVYGLAALARHLLPRARPAQPGAESEVGGDGDRDAVAGTLLRGLALDPQRRPPSCREFLDDLRAALASMDGAPLGSALSKVVAAPIPCVLVVAGSTAKRRELQGLITAVAPRIPVLADSGAHGVTLARRYRPVVLLLDLPSLPPGAAVALCRELLDLAALRTQVIALEPTDVEEQALSRLGATVVSPGGRGRSSQPPRSAETARTAPPAGPARTAGLGDTSSGDSGRWPKPWPAEESLLQLLRRHLQPARGRGA